MVNLSSDPVAAVTEQGATGGTAEIFADIRQTLQVEVVNLIWRHLAIMPGALEWAWTSLKPLYHDAAIAPAAHIRLQVPLPRVPALSQDTLHAAGIDAGALTAIGAILDSYQHTNALALVCFSALLVRFDRSTAQPESTMPTPFNTVSLYMPPRRAALPRLIPLAEMPEPVANLIHELNGFGEDTDPALTASMYRHLAHWPTYLALIRTLLVPLHQSGELGSIVVATRRMGDDVGAQLASRISTAAPREPVQPVLAAVRRFVRHPIARMTGICALIRRVTPACPC
jgi:hypothetical protein